MSQQLPGDFYNESMMWANADALRGTQTIRFEFEREWSRYMRRYIPNHIFIAPPDWETEHSAHWEFLCPCCKKERMNQRFIARLDLSRVIAGIPFVIGSGWRCTGRNAAVGAVPDSSHLRGLAADIIATTGEEKLIIAQSLMVAGFTRIGLARYYIHVDNDPKKPQAVLWEYRGG